MPPSTHCLPSGALGAGELPVPSVSAALMTQLVPSGSKRGVVVMISGASGAYVDAQPTIVDVGGIQPIKWRTLADALVADGWVCISPQYAQHLATPLPWQALYNDVSNDAGHGSRFVAQLLHWWDHIVVWIKAHYGNWPIVPLGFSFGGYHALHIAAGRASSLTAYCAHHPATVLSAIAAAVTAPVDFSATTTTGADTTASMLNAVAKPGLIGWGTVDPVVGFTATQAIYDAAHGAGAPVTSNAQTSGHTIGTADVTAITDWFTATVDPLAPATH